MKATFGFWGNFLATFESFGATFKQLFEKIGATCGQPYPKAARSLGELHQTETTNCQAMQAKMQFVTYYQEMTALHTL